jgi:hypothetical protein
MSQAHYRQDQTRWLRTGSLSLTCSHRRDNRACSCFPPREQAAELLGGYSTGPANRGPCGWLMDGVELDPVHEGVVVDGPGVGGSPAEGFNVCLSGAADIVLVDQREGNQFDRVDLDPAWSDGVPAPRRHFPTAPEPDRDGNLARQDVLAQLLAELHLADSTSQPCGVLPVLGRRAR